jgi:excisionase family DNA binding protein
LDVDVAFRAFRGPEKVETSHWEEDMPTELPELIDITTLAERLGGSDRHIRRLVAGHTSPVPKGRRYVRFDSAEIIQWLKDGRQPVKHGHINGGRPKEST